MNNYSIFGLSPIKRNEVLPTLTITPLGGLGQIGMNCMVIGTSEIKVVVDCGLMFPNDYHLGIDVIIPKFDYIIQHKHELGGILLTHGHEDHIGALPWLVPHLSVPIYGSEFTLALVEHKLRERDLLGRCELVPVAAGQTLPIGDMTVHFFHVNHSIVDGLAIGFDTPAGRVLHTGDFKIDQTPLEGKSTDIEGFREFAGKDGIELLLSDSTNVEQPGNSLSESTVLANLRQLFEQADGRIIVTLFSSHIQRIQEVFDCAKATGRTVAVTGRSLMNNIEIASDLGYLRKPNGLYLGSRGMPSIPDNKSVLLVTGSQGEPMSALSRIACGEHRDYTIHSGDVVILSSRLIPGNALAVNTLINTLYKNGAEVYFNQEYPVHASGHAQQEELKTVIRAVRPKYFVPVHGEYRHLIKHARLAAATGVPEENCHIAENGMPFTLTLGGLEQESPVDAGQVFVDGKGVGDVGQLVLKERHLLGGGGLVIALLVLDEATGSVLHGPEIFSKGFIFEQQLDHLLEDAKCLILDTIEERGHDVEKLREGIHSSLRRFFRRILDRDPVVIPVVIKV